MQLSEARLNNRKTLIVANRIANIKGNQQSEPFPNLQKSKRVCSVHQLTPAYLSGSTWDAQHLSNLVSANMNKELTSRTNLIQSVNSTLSLNNNRFEIAKNASRYGYTNVFPLIQNSQSTKNIISLNKQTSNTNPIKLPPDTKPNKIQLLTSRQRLDELVISKQQLEQSRTQKNIKLKQIRQQELLKQQFPHGINGVQNPESANPQFSQRFQHQKKNQLTQRYFEKYVRTNLFKEDAPMQNDFPKAVYQLSADFKSKKHLILNHSEAEIKPMFKLFPKPKREYNIISNAGSG